MMHVKTPRKAQGRPIPLPAPSKGMNTLDNYMSLAPDKARYLENWLPASGRCTFRPGYSTFSTLGSASSGLTLMEYNGNSGTELLAVGGNGYIFRASAGAASALATGYTPGAPFSYDNMNGYLIAVNGTDTPFRYDGATIAATGLTGVSLPSLRTVKQVKNRLWFTLTDSPNPWYTNIASIAGSLTEFQLDQECNGGYLMGVFSWQDYTVFALSTGEVVVYAGDPSTDFSKYGTYKMPEPVDYDAAVKIGGELVFLTKAGPIPMEMVTKGLAFDADQLAGWAEIQPSWTDDAALYGSTAGWTACYRNGIAYFNVPTGGTTAKQYVLNLNIPGGAWTTYSGLNAGQWAKTESGVYFTDRQSGRVCVHSGTTDDGAEIVAVARQGFSYPSRGQQAMQFTMGRLNYSATGSATAQLQVDIDFREFEFTSPSVTLSLEGGGGAWDEAWDSSWGMKAVTQMRWQKIKGYGKAVAPAVSVRSGSGFDWYATDIMTAGAGVL